MGRAMYLVGCMLRGTDTEKRRERERERETEGDRHRKQKIKKESQRGRERVRGGTGRERKGEGLSLASNVCSSTLIGLVGMPTSPSESMRTLHTWGPPGRTSTGRSTSCAKR